MAGNINDKTMENKLVIFDIDGTIDGIPLNELLPVLREYGAQGVVFGINTNRPFQESVGYYDSLDMHGPFIVENGASFRRNRQSEPEVFSENVIEVNKLIFGILNRGDSGVRALMSGDKSFLDNTGQGLVAMVTESRCYTSSIYVRADGVISRETTKMVMGVVRQGLVESNDLVGLSIDGSGGKVLAWNTLTDRLKTLFRIWKNHYSTHDVLIVSDSEPESTECPPATFAAVFGADIDYWNRCDIRASVKGANGLRQIMEQFLRRSI